MRFAFVPVLLFLSVGAAGAQSAPAATPPSAPRLAHAARRVGPISLDGRLDEAAWAPATPGGDFIEAYPSPGKTAPDRTEFRVLYDDQALYFGIRMFDAHPDSIAATLTPTPSRRGSPRETPRPPRASIRIGCTSSSIRIMTGAPRSGFPLRREGCRRISTSTTTAQRT